MSKRRSYTGPSDVVSTVGGMVMNMQKQPKTAKLKTHKGKKRR